MHFLLIHGSWHGAWCWEKLATEMKRLGHEVHAMDLPGAGTRFQEARSVTFEEIQACIADAIQSLPKPLRVVAHSSAGMTSAEVLETYADRLDRIYYISAWLPRENASLIDMATSYPPTELPALFINREDPDLTTVDPSGAKSVFYHDCTEAEQEWAASRLKPKAARPDLHKVSFQGPVHTLEKTRYVLCTKDRVVDVKTQRDIADRFGPSPDPLSSLR